MIVIADTSPLTYLIRIGEIEVLPQLYEHIVIPAAVCNELKSPLAPQAVRDWTTHYPTWLEVRIPEWQPDAELISAALDDGERDAILLALELRADELIIDDMDGRREAERRKLHYIGTLGVLRDAARARLLNLKGALARLRQTNFHVSQELLDRLLRDEER
jgi:predicted nucleic acid-binding protein